jgi:glutamine synthetase
MEKDPLIKKVLGEDMFTKYVDAKHAEWDESKRQITQWELDQYLFRF